MQEFGSCISIIVNTLLLLVAYVIGVGASAIVARLSGKRFLAVRIERKAKSYWTALNLKKKPVDEYYRQF